MAHARQSARWVEGAPIRTIEEFQSDWHQEAGRAIAYTEEGEPIRRGYKSQARLDENEALVKKSVEAHEKSGVAAREMNDKRDEAYSALALNQGTEMEALWGTNNIRGTIIAGYPEQHLFEVRWNEAGIAEYGKEISDGLDFTLRARRGLQPGSRTTRWSSWAAYREAGGCVPGRGEPPTSR
jgi:hypothetical protein